ncbi:UNVERIFIED_ORG: hypothetical protein J2W66_003932 [Agrobacterium larrymoorei]|nr:hypothetical protein [Agrobacterium larrymoorei]
MIEFMRVSSKEISPKGAADLKLVYASCTQRAAQPGRLRFATPKHFCENIVPPEKRPDISFLSSPHKHRQLASQKIALVRARSHRHASGQEVMSISSSSAMRLTLNPPGRPDSAGRALPHVSQAVHGDRHDLGRSQFCQSHSCARSAVEVVEGKGGITQKRWGGRTLHALPRIRATNTHSSPHARLSASHSICSDRAIAVRIPGSAPMSSETSHYLHR